MSGLGNFSLNTLGNMSTLGSLAQSAQRLDRLMAGNRSRQEDNYGRNNSRRLMDDDFFGGRSSDRGRRRSPSPPRRFNRDDRRNDDRRGRRRSRDDNIYGATSGAGILGAAPSGNDRSSMNSGLGDRGGSSWNDNNPRGGLNLDTQTQQLLNMMQTQQLLAAVQAQAKLANQQPPSLMGTNTGYSRQGGRMMNQRGGGRFGRNDPPRQGFNRRDDRKRRRSPVPRPFKRDRKDDSATRKDARKTSTGDKDEAKKDTKPEGKETKAKTQGKGAEAKDKKQESTGQGETKIANNAAGENVEELVKTNYDGTRYWCTLCKIVCLKSKNIYKHFVSERHVKAAVEKQGKVFDPEIMKQQELKKEEAKRKTPKDISEFLKYVCTTKQTAKKVNNDIYISSLTDCTVKIMNFTTEQDFMGSEFVKAVSGFKCQLCKTFLRHGHQITEHLQGKRHNANYEKYLKENPEYLTNQRDVNKNLVEMLKKDEGKDVVLQESNGEAPRADVDHTLDGQDEEPDFMDEYDPNENSNLDDDSKTPDESINDSALNDSIQDYSLVDSEKDADQSKVEESEVKNEMKEVNDEVQKNEVGNDDAAKKEMVVEENDISDISEEKPKELPMEADEVEEEFPLLEPPANPIKEDDPVEPKDEVKPKVEVKQGVETKQEVVTNVSEVVTKVPDVEMKAKEPETPETPTESAFEPGETEEVTPTRRGRKGKRGRGGAKVAARGRRRTPRAAKNVKKTEEVIEPGEIVDAPEEAEKEPEKEAEPKVPVAGIPEAKVDELASSQETEASMTLSQESSGSVEGIDAFEVIDEVEDASGDDSEDEDEA